MSANILDRPEVVTAFGKAFIKLADAESVLVFGEEDSAMLHLESMESPELLELTKRMVERQCEYLLQEPHEWHVPRNVRVRGNYTTKAFYRPVKGRKRAREPT